MKLWSGRFKEKTDKLVDDFNSSIRFDSKLYKYDIEGSIAHVNMLGKQEVISVDESKLIVKTLKEILLDVKNSKIEFDAEMEDIHLNIEKILVDRIGSVGKKVHSGRSRNDQVALDIRMYLKDELANIKTLLFQLETVLIEISSKNINTIMPGYTHLQKAQPITLALHMMAYFEMFKRDMERIDDCFKRVDISPLGAGALAGTSYPIDRDYTARELGFSKASLNALDSVSDRDFIIEALNVFSIIIMHLSRFCEEIILWATGEFNFIELSDDFSTGSSIMPQKKNPDVAELIRGKSGRIYGNLISVLVMMKGLPLAYNKDMQEDKEPLFDSVDNIKICIKTFIGMIKKAKFNKQRMESICVDGFIDATDAADYLVKKGMPFRDAHEVIGKIVSYCIENKTTLQKLTIDEYKVFSKLFENDVYKEISIENAVASRKSKGAAAENVMVDAIKDAKLFLNKIK